MPLVYHFLQRAGALGDRRHNFCLEEVLDKILVHAVYSMVIIAHITLISNFLNADLVQLPIANNYFPSRNLFFLVA